MMYISITAMIAWALFAVAVAAGKYKPGRFVTTMLFIGLLLGEIVYFVNNYTSLGAQ